MRFGKKYECRSIQTGLAAIPNRRKQSDIENKSFEELRFLCWKCKQLIQYNKCLIKTVWGEVYIYIYMMLQDIRIMQCKSKQRNPLPYWWAEFRRCSYICMNSFRLGSQEHEAFIVAVDVSLVYDIKNCVCQHFDCLILNYELYHIDDTDIYGRLWYSLIINHLLSSKHCYCSVVFKYKK